MSPLMSPADAFQHAAQCAAAYRFDIGAEAGEFYRTHPSLAGKVVFTDIVGATAVASPGFALQGKDLYHAMAKKDVRFVHRVTNAFYLGESFVQQDDELINVFIHGAARRQNLPRLLGAMASSHLESVSTVDHEEGHILSPGTQRIFNLGECIADSYMALRHMQRFGMDSPYLENIVAMRAVELFFRNDKGEHFTSPVIETVLETAGGNNVLSLSRYETIRRAEKYSERYSNYRGEIQEVARDFQAFNGKLPYVMKEGGALLKSFARKAGRHKSPLAGKWAAVAVKAILEGRVLCNGLHIQPEKNEWTRLHSRVARRLGAR
jgi:hypothetical protein